MDWDCEYCPRDLSVAVGTVTLTDGGTQWQRRLCLECYEARRGVLNVVCWVLDAEDATPAPAPGATSATPPPVAKLPADSRARKETPIARGVLDYFPLAIAEVARVSKKGNDQHNPGEPMHWARGKSTDHADCIVRHLIDRGTVDSDGMRHTAKLAWRALALLQTELEDAEKKP